MKYPPAIERFWKKVEKSDGCWIWRNTNPKEYPRIMVDGRRIKVHRYSWTVHFGPIPDGLEVCHTCDNTQCVRPDHLFLGTHLDNMRDMYAKGYIRRGPQRGSLNHNVRHSWDTVRAVREEYRQGGVTQRQLAQKYGMAQGHVSRLINETCWPGENYAG